MQFVQQPCSSFCVYEYEAAYHEQCLGPAAPWRQPAASVGATDHSITFPSLASVTDRQARPMPELPADSSAPWPSPPKRRGPSCSREQWRPEAGSSGQELKCARSRARASACRSSSPALIAALAPKASCSTVSTPSAQVRMPRLCPTTARTIASASRSIDLFGTLTWRRIKSHQSLPYRREQRAITSSVRTVSCVRTGEPVGPPRWMSSEIVKLLWSEGLTE